jgi:hypothetical protein
MGFDRLPFTVEPKDLGPACGRPEEPQEEPDGRGLASSVRAQIADHFPSGHLQIQILQGVQRPVAFRQALGSNGSTVHRRSFDAAGVF